MRITMMLKFGAVASTIHGLIKFPTTTGVAIIQAIIKRTIECNQFMEPIEITRGKK